MAQNPTINGFYYDESSISVQFALSAQGAGTSSDSGLIEVTDGLTDISFSDKMTPTQVRNLGAVKLGTGLGKYEADFSITMVQEYYTAFARAIAEKSANGKNLTTVKLDVTVMLVAPGSAVVTTFRIREARIKERNFAKGEGIMRQVPFDVRYIEERDPVSGNWITLVPIGN